MNKSASQHDMTALMQEAIECLPNGFCIMDQDMRPIIANRMVREAFNYYFQAIESGKPYLEAHFLGVKQTHPDASDEYCWRVAHSIDRHIRDSQSINLVTSDGRIVKAVYRKISGNRVVAVYIDLSDLRKRSLELEAARYQAETASRAKSAFLANMSHEIRTPLNGILGMAQVLAQEDLLPEQHEQIDIILESGQTLKSLLDDVLDLSKIEAGRMALLRTEANLVHLVKRQYSLWLPRAQEKNLDFKLTIQPDVPEQLRIDPVRFGQCLSNLFSNAIKFTERGEVCVEVNAHPAGERAEIEIVVRDSGVGMGKDTLDRLFTPFGQADSSISRRFGGTGLGLVITRRLAQLMDGDVRAESEEGAGSTFTLTFLADPVTDRPAGDTEQVPLLPADPSLQGRRVLIVDDHPVNRRVTCLFLQPHGFEIAEAEDGLQALDKLEQQPFDLVLMDIHMPVLDGLETLRRMRSSGKSWSNLPVVALTADAMSGDRERYLAEGMDGYISKPITQEGLLEEVARLLSDNPHGQETLPPRLAEVPLTSGIATSEPQAETTPLSRDFAATAPDQEPDQSLAEAKLTEIRDACRAAEARRIERDGGLLAIMEEAMESLPHGFAILNRDLKPILANTESLRTFADYYSAIAQGLSAIEANAYSVECAMPHLSDRECRHLAEHIEAHQLDGKQIDLKSRDRIFRTIYSRMSGDRCVAVSIDITESRKRENELERARQDAEAANQAKSTFLANMSHEIRTPLNGVLGMAQVLAQSDLPEDCQEQVEIILESGNTLKMLLDDVLDLSKIEAGRMEVSPTETDLKQLLRRQQMLWLPRAREKGLSLKLFIAPGVPGRLNVDPIRVGQCLTNLISNAIKFTEWGEVRIMASAHGRDEHVELIFDVTDTGIGMGEDMAKRLFAPFSQADNSTSRRFGGTGLGLVITRKLAVLMGGDVTVYTQEGRGSTFTLKIMADRAEQSSNDDTTQASETHATDTPSGKHVLIVDDHPVNRRVGRLFLEPEGYQVSEAATGLEALQKLKEDRFDLVLLDTHMPGLDGIETLRKIRQSGEGGRKLPVIGLTADTVTGERELYLSEGMSGCVEKPIDQRNLLTEVSRVLSVSSLRAVSEKGRSLLSRALLRGQSGSG